MNKNYNTDETRVVSCYVDQVIDNTSGAFDDIEYAEIVVPKEWVEKMVKYDGWESLEHFLEYYVYDDVTGWLEQAIKNEVLLGLHLGITGD